MRKKSIKAESSNKSANVAKKHTLQCKNCSTLIEGNFCHHCGQRFHDHKESFSELAYEFGSDFLHFDSKFFKTIVPLLFLPGTLTKLYNEGKQKSQFHPIRLYLFSSFVYFFLFFYFNNLDEQIKSAKFSDEVTETEAVNKIAKEANGNIPSMIADTGINNKAVAEKNTFFTVKDSERNYSLTITPEIDSLIQKKVSPEEYKQIQKRLTGSNRDSYIERMITIKLLEVNMEGETGKKDYLVNLFKKILHNLPKLMFLLLPVFALILKLLYIRRKQFYYVDHAILSLHYFSFIFLILALSNYCFDRIFRTDIFSSAALIWIAFYLLFAMKKLYKQGWAKTCIKYISLGFIFLFSVILSLILNIAFSAFI